MPSLQTVLPPELANNAIRLYRECLRRAKLGILSVFGVFMVVPFFFMQLYRECLRRAKYIGNKQHNTALVVSMVRQQFKKHMHETDAEKIQKLKDDAARGLINHILFETEQMTGRKFSCPTPTS